jgi:hypothetical protein
MLWLATAFFLFGNLVHGDKGKRRQGSGDQPTLKRGCAGSNRRLPPASIPQALVEAINQAQAERTAARAE